MVSIEVIKFSPLDLCLKRSSSKALARREDHAYHKCEEQTALRASRKKIQYVYFLNHKNLYLCVGLYIIIMIILFSAQEAFDDLCSILGFELEVVCVK